MSIAQQAGAGRRALHVLPRGLSTVRGFRILSLVTLAALWVIVPSGGLVRLTGSGLGCPDWPLCDGGVVPASGYHSVIEYSNRVASFLVLVLTVVTWIASRAVPGAGRNLRTLAAVTSLLSLGQIPLGGITVLTDLHPLMVGSHFLLSLLGLITAVLLAYAARDLQTGTRRGWSVRRGPFAVIAAVALSVVVVTGVLVTAAGPHSGDSHVVNRFGHLEDAAWVHVRAVAVLVVLMVVLGVWLWRERPADPFAGTLIAAFIPLMVAQIVVGELQYRHGLPWGVVALHVTISGILWIVGWALAWAVARPPVSRGTTAPART